MSTEEPKAKRVPIYCVHHNDHRVGWSDSPYAEYCELCRHDEWKRGYECAKGHIQTQNEPWLAIIANLARGFGKQY